MKAFTPIAKILVVGALLMLPPAANAEQLSVRSYRAPDGLAQDRVKGIVRDSRGFLWFCTADGLSRFDGARFTTYDASNGLAFSSINDLLETRGGAYWVATNGGGVLRFNFAVASRAGGEGAGKNLTTGFPVSSSAPTNRVNKLYEDSAGRVWAGTDDGLYLMEVTGDAPRFSRVELDVPGEPRRVIQVWNFVEDDERSLWIGTTYGLFRRTADGRLERFGVTPRSAGNVAALLHDAEGRIWAGHNNGLLIFKPGLATEEQQPWRVVERTGAQRAERGVALPDAPGEAHHYTEADGLGKSWVTSLYGGADGRVWLATWGGGLTEFSGNRFRSYSVEQGIGEKMLTSVVEDRDGNIWMGTRSRGATKLARNGLVTFREEDGLSNADIKKIFADRGGRLCVIVSDDHINCYDGQRFVAVRPNLPAEVTQLYDALQDREGRWWAATARGLYRFPQVSGPAGLARAAPQLLAGKEGVGGDRPLRLFEDSRGDVWVGTSGASPLSRWDRASDTFFRYSSGDNLPEGKGGVQFAEDKSGGVWIGFGREGGLARYRGGRFLLLTAADGLPPGDIRGLHVSRDNRIWVGAGMGGLLVIEDPTAERPRLGVHAASREVTSGIVRSITEDEDGRLYLGTPRAVERFEPSTNRVKRFTVADGLASNESSIAFRDSRGALWFGTLNGISRLTPGPDPPAQPPPIFIGGLTVAGVPQAVSELGESEIKNLRFEHGQNQVRVDFFSLGFAPGEILRYQHKLEGSKGDWSVPVEERTVFFAGMRPGAYRFLVRAINADGVMSERPASVAFTILPPVWMRPWFIALAATVMMLLTYAVYRHRVRRLVELERVRTRIATDLHDDIGASLSKIALLSDVAAQEIEPARTRAAEPLAIIASTSREMVDAMSDIVWAINPQRDHMSDLTHRMRRFAGDMLGARDIEFTFRAPADERDIRLGADLRREVYLIFKECVNNLVKHSGATEAELAFRVAGGWLVVEIGDNGSGFDAGASSNDKHDGLGGHGLASMRRRAEALGGTFMVESKKGEGTRAVLKVPTGGGGRGAWWTRNYPNGQ